MTSGSTPVDKRNVLGPQSKKGPLVETWGLGLVLYRTLPQLGLIKRVAHQRLEQSSSPQGSFRNASLVRSLLFALQCEE